MAWRAPWLSELSWGLEPPRTSEDARARGRRPDQVWCRQGVWSFREDLRNRERAEYEQEPDARIPERRIRHASAGPLAQPRTDGHRENALGHHRQHGRSPD